MVRLHNQSITARPAQNSTAPSAKLPSAASRLVIFSSTALLLTGPQGRPMKSVCSMYCALCKRWGPKGMTVSAYAWERHMAGGSWLRNRIDGAWLMLFGIEQHCHSSFQRERANNSD